MSAKGKGKADNTALMVNNNGDEGTLISAITVIKFKKDTLIKIKKPAIFTKDRTKFLAYKTSVSLAVWANNKRTIPNRIMKTIPAQIT
jgi:hypothetical protein